MTQILLGNDLAVAEWLNYISALASEASEPSAVLQNGLFRNLASQATAIHTLYECTAGQEN